MCIYWLQGGSPSLESLLQVGDWQSSSGWPVMWLPHSYTIVLCLSCVCESGFAVPKLALGYSCLVCQYEALWPLAKGLSFISNCQQLKEGTCCVSELAGIEPTPPAPENRVCPQWPLGHGGIFWLGALSSPIRCSRGSRTPEKLSCPMWQHCGWNHTHCFGLHGIFSVASPDYGIPTWGSWISVDGITAMNSMVLTAAVVHLLWFVSVFLVLSAPIKLLDIPSGSTSSSQSSTHIDRERNKEDLLRLKKNIPVCRIHVVVLWNSNMVWLTWKCPILATKQQCSILVDEIIAMTQIGLPTYQCLCQDWAITWFSTHVCVFLTKPWVFSLPLHDLTFWLRRLSSLLT